MKNLKQFHYPETLEEALEFLRDESVKTGIIAGGTSMSLSRSNPSEALVDVTRMGLDYIKEDAGYLTIGATTTIQDLVKSESVQKLADGILAKACSVVASRPLRNMITVGGNIVKLRIWSDLPTLLLALDAQVKIKGYDERVIPADDFFKEHPKKHVAKDEIVTEISLPLTPENSGAEFIKLSKTIGDYAIINVACYLEFEGKEVSLARVVVGSVSPLPGRCREAEKLLEGKEPTDELIGQAAKKARVETRTINNLWGSAEYRSIMVEKLVARALKACRDKAAAK